MTFSSLVATAEFFKFPGILGAALSQHHLLGFEIAQMEFHHIHYQRLNYQHPLDHRQSKEIPEKHLLLLY